MSHEPPITDHGDQFMIRRPKQSYTALAGRRTKLQNEDLNPEQKDNVSGIELLKYGTADIDQKQLLCRECSTDIHVCPVYCVCVCVCVCLFLCVY